MIPVGTTAPRQGFPVLVVALIAACTLIFLWQESLPPLEAQEAVIRYALIPLQFSSDWWAIQVGLNPNDYTPFVTMAFLHGSWLHLILNMWTLWLFGRAVESRMGTLRFGVLYVLCILLASTAHAWVHADSRIPTLGASGAIAGVLGAHAALFPRSRVVLLIPIIIIPFFFRLPAFIFVGLWFALQILQGASTALSPTMGSGVAWWAHIGGFFAGLAFVGLLTPPAAGPPDTPSRAEPDRTFSDDRSSRWPNR